MMAVMRVPTDSRRRFLSSAALLAGANPLLPVTKSFIDTKAAQLFIDNWDAAWKAHDVPSMAQLHTDDAVTVNRFGTIV